MDASPLILPTGSLPRPVAADRPQEHGLAGRDAGGAETGAVPPPACAAEPSLARSPTALDRAVGRRIRERRVALGMPLQLLSRRVGVSGPQLQRYEMGHTRISTGRLIAIANALDTSVEILAGPSAKELSRAPAEAALLLSAFQAIPCPARRRALVELARSIAMDDAEPRR